MFKEPDLCRRSLMAVLIWRLNRCYCVVSLCVLVCVCVCVCVCVWWLGQVGAGKRILTVWHLVQRPCSKWDHGLFEEYREGQLLWEQRAERWEMQILSNSPQYPLPWSLSIFIICLIHVELLSKPGWTPCPNWHKPCLSLTRPHMIG